MRLPGDGSRRASRLAVTEAPIDALSLAALEAMRADTLYAATGGGMGPGTVQAIERMLAAVAAVPGALLVSGTDANAAGERFAVRHAQLAAAACVAFARLRPPAGVDWNEVLKQESAP
ncbi:MAG: toprim domain-containing protein [Rhodospirillales bacterium]|nr:toprim domain-containing protein [Rhodospirillales bacterium]